MVVLLLALLAALLWLPEHTNEIASPLVSEALMYTLWGVDLAILLALLFVLGRNLIKLWTERGSAPFARFRTKLVLALLAMTIVPSVLVLISGSELINKSVNRWFSVPASDVLEASQRVAAQYFDERKTAVESRSRHLARTLPIGAVSSGDVAALKPRLDDELQTLPDAIIELYRVVPAPGGQNDVGFVFAAQSGSLETVRASAEADRLAARALTSGKSESDPAPLDTGGVLIRTATPIVSLDRPVGVVVVSQHISPEINTQARRADNAYRQYAQLSVMKGPLTGVYFALFLMVTLLILVSATWMGLYLAKRITRPVQMLAAGARAIGAGQLDFRLEPETGDELGSLVESFNMMAAELRTSQEKLELSRGTLERTNVEVDARRRYIETILERVATVVISIDEAGNISTVNGAGMRLLGLDRGTVGQSAATVFAREDLRPLLPLVDGLRQRNPAGVVHEITLARDDREIHLAAASTALTSDAGRAEGGVIVLDDVTPLIRAQRVAAWRDVARRLAHEIKNPLTPIQLSAERLRRNFGTATPQVKALVDECTDAIITEVEALKGLVDEFAQFARLRGPKTVPAELNRLVDDTLRLYNGVLQHSSLKLERQLEADLPAVRIDVEQIRQVIINLVDNAMEALGGPTASVRPDGRPATIVVSTSHDARNGIARLAVSDNGPGVPAADRDKLFMPYYSTKGRGSGLGLAIVRRIVAEHGGGIEVSDVQPSGTTFTVELPAS